MDSRFGDLHLKPFNTEAVWGDKTRGSI